MNLTQSEILFALDKLSIDKSDKQNGDWLFIRCPFHIKILGKEDKHIGNCSVNLSTGIIHCFACKHSEHISALIQKKFNLDYKQTYNFITGKDYKKKEQQNNDLINKKIDYNLNKKEERKKINGTVSQGVKVNYINSRHLRDFNSQDYYYTRIRGFTKEFCKQFNIKKCVSGYYKDYFIIPIIDSRKKIMLFESRKLMQYEKQLLKIEEITDFDLEYLENKKVLYPSGASYIKSTLFNIDNLDRNEDLWVSEGSGTIPKVYLNISKNITCTFGSEITEEQVEYLKQFKKRKIIIPDNDKASLLAIENLNNQVEDLYIIDIKSEDKDRKFIKDIGNNKIVKASKYLLNNYQIF